MVLIQETNISINNKKGSGGGGGNRNNNPRFGGYQKKIFGVLFIGFYTWFLFQTDLFQQQQQSSSLLMTKSAAFDKQQYDPKTICDTKLPTQIYDDWNYMNQTLYHNFPNEDVSGGIFLYPRQASALYTMIQHLARTLGQIRLSNQNSIKKPFTICETGFGSGHSMSLFLHSVSATNARSNTKYCEAC